MNTFRKYASWPILAIGVFFLAIGLLIRHGLTKAGMMIRNMTLSAH